MNNWEIAILSLYALTMALLAVYGLHRYQLVFLHRRHQADRIEPRGHFDREPVVTIQLPIFNEKYVMERLIGAVCEIDWPKDRLEIQVLDDSTDDTRELAAATVAKWREAGVDIRHLHREDRTGYKAGALDAGMAEARGDYVAIFDADFVPPRDLLRQTIDHFADDSIGMVQVRWEHLNRRHSLLTRIQALMLDGHFLIEHTARNRSGRFFNFNGTAGIWRRQCIAEAGGWQHDTLTEDLDLSYRAQMAGWRFLYLPTLTAPAELPVEMNSFKSQQHRWTKGSIQTGIKLLPSIWRSALPLRVKIEATFHLTNNVAYPLMIALSLLLGPAIWIRHAHGLNWFPFLDLPLFLCATMSVAAFYLAAPGRSAGSRLERLLLLPALMALGIGLAVNNTKAVIEAAFKRDSPFVRTPKHRIEGERSHSWVRMTYRAKANYLPLIELGLGAWFCFVCVQAWRSGQWSALPFLLLFASGFLMVGVLSMAQRLTLRMRLSS